MSLSLIQQNNYCSNAIILNPTTSKQYANNNNIMSQIFIDKTISSKDKFKALALKSQADTYYFCQMEKQNIYLTKENSRLSKESLRHFEESKSKDKKIEDLNENMWRVTKHIAGKEVSEEISEIKVLKAISSGLRSGCFGIAGNCCLPFVEDRAISLDKSYLRPLVQYYDIEGWILREFPQTHTNTVLRAEIYPAVKWFVEEINEEIDNILLFDNDEFDKLRSARTLIPLQDIYTLERDPDERIPKEALNTFLEKIQAIKKEGLKF